MKNARPTPVSLLALVLLALPILLLGHETSAGNIDLREGTTRHLRFQKVNGTLQHVPLRHAGKGKGEKAALRGGKDRKGPLAGGRRHKKEGILKRTSSTASAMLSNATNQAMQYFNGSSGNATAATAGNGTATPITLPDPVNAGADAAPTDATDKKAPEAVAIVRAPIPQEAEQPDAEGPPTLPHKAKKSVGEILRSPKGWFN